MQFLSRQTQIDLTHLQEEKRFRKKSKNEKRKKNNRKKTQKTKRRSVHFFIDNIINAVCCVGIQWLCRQDTVNRRYLLGIDEEQKKANLFW